jgi:hypothetical protein
MSDLPEELKPCPFCGCVPEFSPESEYNTETVYHKIGSSCPLTLFAFSVEEWNTRKPDARVAELERMAIPVCELGKRLEEKLKRRGNGSPGLMLTRTDLMRIVRFQEALTAPLEDES